jgi:tetratricopeptide (TPR) repeat protein
MDAADPQTSAPEPAPEAAPEPPFLDPHELIEHSQPASRAGLFWYILGAFLVVVLVSTIVGRQSPEAERFVRLFGAIAMIGLLVALSLLTWFVATRQREEQRRLEAIEELIQLRRWPDAAVQLQMLLSAPTRTPLARVQGLIYLSAVLARYHRYGDAIAVQEHLLEHVYLQGGAEYALRLGRAMALLHEERLVDADRAIAELRRVEGSSESAGLALVEIYRDVKTGHPAEAIEMFQAKIANLRRQLGHRVADGWALVARAYDMVGRADLAAEAYTNATSLAPIAELSRKYGEVAALTGKYAPATAPVE